MSKNRAALYFQKRYSLLLHSVVANQKISIASVGNHTGLKQVLQRSCAYNINQVVEVSCIDMVQNGVTIPDNQPTIMISAFDHRQGKRIEIGQVRFDMNFEKMLRPDSSVVYSKELQGGRGSLSYKFISVGTRTLTNEEYAAMRGLKEEVLAEFAQDDLAIKLKNLMTVLQSKDNLVQSLQKKIEELILQTNRRGGELANERARSIEKKIALSLKINPTERHLRHQNETLKAALEEQMSRVKMLQSHVDELTEEKQMIEKSLVMSKRQYQKLSQLYKSGKEKSMVGDKPKFLKLSTENIPAQQQLLRTESPRKAKAPDVSEQRRARRNTIAATNSVYFAGNSLIKQSQKLDTVIEEENKDEMANAAVRNSLYINKEDPYSIKLLAQPASPSKQVVEDDSKQKALSLNKRISMQKDDLKLSALIFEKDEELLLVQKRCQLFEAQAKQLEKEVDKYQELLKKKEIQIRQLKRKSKRNLIQASSTNIRNTKNNAEVESHLDKLQTEFENERVTFEQEIDRLGVELKNKNKEMKQLKMAYDDYQMKGKALEQRYSQIKIANKKISQELIEFKQKALQFDKIGENYQKLENDNRVLNEKVASFTDQNSKLEGLYNKILSKSRDLQKQVDRLRKIQRDYQYLRNQNLNFRQTIEGYQNRYNQLKKYCLKMEYAYNKFTSKAKKSSLSSSQMQADDKEMQQKFAELSKMVNQYESNYFKNQIEDCQNEVQLVTMYYEKKKMQEVQKIMESRDITEDLKKSQIKEKEVEFQKQMNQKCNEIQTKMRNLEKNFEELQHRSIDGSQTFIETVPEKVKRLEMKVSSIIEKENSREAERKELKDTISNLQEELKMARSNAFLSRGQQAASQNQLLQSMINENRQRKTMLEEARLKSEQVQLKAYEQNRKLNTALMKENHEVKSQLSKLKMESERAERKAQEREKNIEAAFKKSEYEYKLKIQKLTEEMQKLQTQHEKVKEECDDQRNGVENLTSQISQLSTEVSDKDVEIGSLHEKIDTLEQTIRDYQKAEKKMREEVEQIKSRALLNEKQFVTLMEARNQDFLKIQQLKQTEIQKLKGVITMLQQNLQSQMFENMKNVSAYESIKEKMEQLQKESQAKIEDVTLALENRIKDCDDLYAKEFLSSRECETLKMSLMEISSEIQTKEMENVQLTLKNESLKKQMEVYERQAKEYQQTEKKCLTQMEELKTTLKDKIYQISYFQQRFRRVQTEVEMSALQMQRLSTLNAKYEDTIANWQTKYSDKEEEIIKLKQENSLLMIEEEKLKLHFSGLGQENQMLKKRYEEIEAEVARLNESIVRISRQKEEKEVNMTRRYEPSFVQEDPNPKIQINSPTRRPRSKSPVKRTSSIDHNSSDLSSLGFFGGITPINPVPSQGFPKRMDSLDQKDDTSNLLVPSRKGSGSRDGREKEKPEQTQIQINLEQFTQVSNINTAKNIGPEKSMEDQRDQLTISNAQSLMQTNLGMQALIREETEQHQESHLYGKNIDLAEGNHHTQHQGEEEEDWNEVVDKYQNEIKELKQELTLACEQNERLKIEVMQLQDKLADLTVPNGHTQKIEMQIPRQLLERNQGEQKQEPMQVSLNKSNLFNKSMNLNKTNINRSTILNKTNIVQSREMKKSIDSIGPQPPKLTHNRQRSNSGGGELRKQREAAFEQIEQQYQAAELEVQEMRGVISSLKSELEQSNQNNEKLIKQIEICNQLLQQKQDEIQETKFEVEQWKKFQVFEGYYQKQVEKVKQLSIKIQELASEVLLKESKIAQALKENTQAMSQIHQQRQELLGREEQNQKLQKRLKEQATIISRMKLDYRTYEQTSELQIVHLREEVEQLKSQVGQLEADKVELAEQYLQLQKQKDDIVAQLQAVGKQIIKREASSNQQQQRIDYLEQQLTSTQQKRQQLLKNVRRLQSELMQKSESIKNIAADSSLSIRKYEIKLQGNQEELKAIAEKISEKEKTISLLKNQIALYNEESEELRKSNDALNYQLVKVEKQLKDIVQVYGKEIEGMQISLKDKDVKIRQLNDEIKEKQKGFDAVMKQMRAAQRERDVSKAELLEVESKLEKVKQVKSREMSEINSKYQFKVDECEKVKAALEKVNTQLATKEMQMNSLSGSHQKRLRGYKEKYEKYQSSIAELQQELKKVQDRPSVETYQQVVFENELLRTEIDELREQVGRGTSRAKEEQIYSEFRTYKRSREQQIQDLENQMERYGAKIGELEETVFKLKRENQSLRESNAQLSEVRVQLQAQVQDLRESMVDVQKQLQFYKKRKMLDMQKLLNETH